MNKEKYLSELNILEMEIGQIMLESTKINITLMHQSHEMFDNIYTKIVFGQSGYMVTDSKKEKLPIPVGNFHNTFPLQAFNLEGKRVESCSADGRDFVIKLERAKLVFPISEIYPESVSIYVDDGPDAFLF